MSGIFFSNRDIDKFIYRHDTAGLDDYLNSRPGYDINDCYCYLGHVGGCFKWGCILAYPAKVNDLKIAEILLKHGACFDEIKEHCVVNPINQAGSPAMKAYMIRELLSRIIHKKKYLSGVWPFYKPLSEGVSDVIKEINVLKGKSPGKFLFSLLTYAIANGDSDAAKGIIAAIEQK